MSRPRRIVVNGGTLNLGVHDAYFLARYKVLRQQMFDCHPDRRRQTMIGVTASAGKLRPIVQLRFPQSTGAFRLAQALLARWLADEDRWYAPTGWPAPKVSRPTVSARPLPEPPASPTSGNVLPGGGSTRQAVLATRQRTQHTTHMATITATGRKTLSGVWSHAPRHRCRPIVLRAGAKRRRLLT
jgi:hypothetical protein